MAASTDSERDFKAAAIEQWTADPCGPTVNSGAPGSRQYFERLLSERRDYAPWMDEELDYAGAANQRVLDIGCGQGMDLGNYGLAGALLTGVDLTPRHVELARAHLQALDLSADIRLGDAEALPFPDGVFDRASSNGVLHHTPDMPAALREMRRVLKPGGRACVIVYNRASFHYWLYQVLWTGILRGALLREHSMSAVLSSGVEMSSIGARPLVKVYAPRTMRALMRDAGFSDVSVSVRHFRAEDTIVTSLLAPKVSALRDPRVLDRIGRVGGWYVIAKGRSPRP